MLKSHPFAKKKSIKVTDLIGQPLYCSEQSWSNEIPQWARDSFDKLHLEGSFRLSYNGSMFAKEVLGILLTFEHLIDCSKESGLVFRPLSPKSLHIRKFSLKIQAELFNNAFSPCFLYPSHHKISSELPVEKELFRIHLDSRLNLSISKSLFQLAYDGYRSSYEVSLPKTKAGIRKIPMLDEVRAALDLEKQNQKQYGYHSVASIDGMSGFIFCNRFGNLLNQETINS